ncbi:hypothetical protein Pelo_19585 [Pelomyxa schiedti]|nr:hypothetical protein Pelo_19585 [Pelomyxa schiedti]
MTPMVLSSLRLTCAGIYPFDLFLKPNTIMIVGSSFSVVTVAVLLVAGAVAAINRLRSRPPATTRRPGSAANGTPPFLGTPPAASLPLHASWCTYNSPWYPLFTHGPHPRPTLLGVHVPLPPAAAASPSSSSPSSWHFSPPRALALVVVPADGYLLLLLVLLVPLATIILSLVCGLDFCISRGCCRGTTSSPRRPPVLVSGVAWQHGRGVVAGPPRRLPLARRR